MGDFIYEEQGYILDLEYNHSNRTNVSNTTTTWVKETTEIIIVSICIIMFIYLFSVYNLLIQKPHNVNNGDMEIRRATRMGRGTNNIDTNQIVFEYNGGDENNVSFTINQLDRNHNSNMISLINDRITEFFENSENTNNINSIKCRKDINSICKDYILQENEECIICKEEFEKNDKMKQLKCEHHFCEQCIKKWFNNNNTCPNCRTLIY